MYRPADSPASWAFRPQLRDAPIDPAAVNTLLDAEQGAPESVRYNVIVHDWYVSCSSERTERPHPSFGPWPSEPGYCPDLRRFRLPIASCSIGEGSYFNSGAV